MPRTKSFISDRLSVEEVSILKGLVIEIEGVELYKNLVNRHRKELIQSFREAVGRWLERYAPTASLAQEVRIAQAASAFGEVGDKADTVVRLASPHRLEIVVEYDNVRADQVAKKFVSRAALLTSQQLVYVAVCYPGTDKMDPREVEKYFGYLAELSQRLGMAGFIGCLPYDPIQQVPTPNFEFL